MASYGASVPVKVWRSFEKTPKVSRDGMASYLARALIRVGMVPIDNWSGVECDDVMFPFEGHTPFGEYCSAYRSQNHGPESWLLFDFPTTEQWLMPGDEVPVRPVLLFLFLNEAGSSGGHVSNRVIPQLIFRRADVDPAVTALDISHLYSYAKSNGNTLNHSFGNYNSTFSTYYPYHEGITPDYAEQGWTDYRVYRHPFQEVSSYVNTWMSTQYWRVALGPFGLMVSVGTGAKREQQGNIINFGIHFGGQRIPGRARAAADDPDQAKVPPVWIQNFTDYYYNGPYGVRFQHASTPYHDIPRSWMQGAQYTDPNAGVVAKTTDPVAVAIFNLEQAQRPMFPYAAKVPDSPRAVNGVGRHILNRLFYWPAFNMLNEAQTFSWSYPAMGLSWTFPRWEECFYLPDAVISDKQAPLGYTIDPVSTDEFLLWYTLGWDTMFGVKVTGGTKYDDGLTDLDAMYPPTIEEVHLDMSSGAGTFGDYTITNTSSFVFQGGEDEVLYDTTSSDTSWLTFTLDVSADPAIGDPGEYIYEVIFEAFNYSETTATSGGTQSDGTFHHQNYLYSEKQGRSQNGTWDEEGAVRIPCAGIDQTYRYYGYADAKMLCYRQSDGTVQFRFGYNYTLNSADPKHMGIRNVRVRKHLRKWWTLL